MYIKLDGENIVGHAYEQQGDYQTKVNGPLVNSLGEYIYKYSGGALVPLSESDVKNHPARQANKQAEMRAARNDRLAAADFVMFSDSPVSADCKSAYEVYRQALRDLPSTIEDIDDFSWPVEPEYVTE